MNRQHTNSEDTITTLFVEILMPNRLEIQFTLLVSGLYRTKGYRC